ncbi:hypothetical protein DH2020_019411 [Rehmannia glutinosa]|uniref:Phospholipid scramblase n=1 Tax=Rehmannia glutinosa TaxID=99300 RepID=A0ABR0WQ79_REHGL
MGFYVLKRGSLLCSNQEDTLWKQIHHGGLSCHVVLWKLCWDVKKPKPSVKARHKVIKSSGSGETFVDGRTLFGLLERSFSGASVINEKSYDKVKSNLKQPPTSQSVTGTLEPISLEESKVAPLLARSNLLITRDIEWANLVLGFEQLKAWCPVIILILIAKFGMLYEVALINCFKKFVEVRGSSSVVYLCYDEMYSSFLEVQENRYAIVDVCYPQAVCFIREQSNVIARQEIGVVHRRWHLWRRIYDLYLGNKQFAVVENPGFWNWTFTLKDIDGNVLAEIDRDWRGFGFEIFTDAGQYVIRFGSADSGVGPATGVQELNVTRSLTLSERAVAVALAVSLDNDYFSRHGGWNKLSPYVLLKKFSQNFVSDDDSTAPSFGRS